MSLEILEVIKNICGNSNHHLLFFFPIGFVRQIVRKALIRLWRFARSVTPRLNKFPRGATLAGKTVVAKQETLD